MLSTTNDYVGVFVANTTDVTQGLRSHPRRPLELRAHRTRRTRTRSPPRGRQVYRTHEYYRFNPDVGATYKLLPGLTLYGGYSEANRAPTAAELACADPDDTVLDRELPDGRPAAEAGRVAHLRAWSARQRWPRSAAASVWTGRRACSVPKTLTILLPNSNDTGPRVLPERRRYAAPGRGAGAVYTEKLVAGVR